MQSALRGPIMIKLTRLNRKLLIVNSDLIEYVEVTPDTVITLTSGHKLVVLETAEEIVERVIAFRKSLLGNDFCCKFDAQRILTRFTEGTGQETSPDGR
jgi:flagellar protein FlbD